MQLSVFVLQSFEIAKSAPLPNTGPNSWLHWIAFPLFSGVSYIFWNRSTESRNVSRSSSLPNPLLEFQLSGV